MSNYGGFQYNDSADPMGGNGGGGGFGSQPSPSGGSKRKAYDEQSLVPVTIRMIMNTTPAISGDGTFALADGRELHQVKFVGAVRSFEESSTNVTYIIEDGTGLIEVKEWMNDDCAAITEMRQAASQENIYVTVIGQVKEYDNKKHVVGYSVRRVGSGNELTHHMLEAVYSAEKHKKGDRIVGAPQAYGAPVSAGVGFGAGPKGAMGGMGQPAMTAGGGGGGGDLQQIILNYIREHGEASDEGVNINQIIGQTTSGGKFTDQQVRGIMQNLSTEGEIYSTIDENTFKSAN